MKVESLLRLLEQYALMAETGDMVMAHMLADQALMDFINHPKVTIAYDAIPKAFE